MALPSFYNINDPARNLADLGVGPYPTPERTLYRAWDGTPIGYGNDCDPITAEPVLSGLVMPDVLEENRLDWLQNWAVPLIAGMHAWAHRAPPLQIAAWAAAGYMAPFPTAGVMAWQSWAKHRQATGLRGLGQHWRERVAVEYQPEKDRTLIHKRPFRPGPWEVKRRCVRFKRVRLPSGKTARRCARWAVMPPREAQSGHGKTKVAGRWRR